MKTVRIVLIGFLLLLLLLTGAGLLQRADWSAERSRVLASPPDAVYLWLDGVDRWPLMLQGEDAPPTTFTTGATAVGAGAELLARSPQGDWTLRIERSHPATGIDYRIDFPRGMHPVHGTLRWEAADAGTRVTLKEGGDVGWGPIERFLRGVVEERHAVELDRRLGRLEQAIALASRTATPAPGK